MATIVSIQPGVRLLQTLYPVSGRSIGNTQPSNVETIGVDTANTIAGTHDGSDLTVDRYHMTWIGDPGEIDGDSDYYIFYTLTPCTVTSAISFVRFVARARITGTASDTQFIIPRMNNGSDASDVYIMHGANGWVNWTRDRTTFTAALGGAGQVWTAALINTKKFGVHLGPVFGGSLVVDSELAEFCLEVWGV